MASYLVMVFGAKEAAKKSCFRRTCFTARCAVVRVSPMFKSKEGHKLGPISCLMVNQNHHNV
jgi:hypothetical protein